MNSKSLINISLSLLLAVVALFGLMALYNYLKTNDLVTPNINSPIAATTTATNISYVNQKYGFSLELPQTWSQIK